MLLVAILLVSAAVSIDVTVVNVAIPDIRADLGGRISVIQLVVSIYPAAFAIFTVPAGRLVDVYGPRRVWTWGAVGYVAAAVLCGVAPFVDWLIAARALQGLSAACLGPAAYTLIAAQFGPQRRGRAVGIVGSGIAVFSVLGSVLGGAVTTALGWRWIFFLTIPVVIAGTALMLAAADVSRRETSSRETVRQESAVGRLDLVGTVLFGVAIILVLQAVSRAGALASSIWPVALAVIGFGVGVVFVTYERRRTEPMIPFEQLENPSVTGALLAASLTTAAFFGMFFYLLIYLQAIEDHSALQAGVMVAPGAFAGISLSYALGVLVDKIGAVIPIALGVALTGASMLVLSAIDPGRSYWTIIFPALLINGVGYSLISIATRTLILNAAAKDEIGRVMSLNGMVKKLGAAFGVAGAAALFHALTLSRLSGAVDKIGIVLAETDIRILERLLGTTTPESGLSQIKDASQSALETIVDDAFVFIFASTLSVIGFVVIGLGVVAVVMVMVGDRRAGR